MSLMPMVFLISLDARYEAYLNLCETDAVYEYEDIKDKEIKWSDIFTVEYSHYYVYFYSPFCGHCLSIKNEVIRYSFCGSEKIFFVEASDEIKIGTNTELTIGATTVEEVWILGYPSLVDIENGVLIMNIAGANTIREFLTY